MSISHIPKNGKQKNNNDNDKLQCFPKKILISLKYKKYSPAKYPLLLIPSGFYTFTC